MRWCRCETPAVLRGLPGISYSLPKMPKPLFRVWNSRPSTPTAGLTLHQSGRWKSSGKLPATSRQACGIATHRSPDRIWWPCATSLFMSILALTWKSRSARYKQTFRRCLMQYGGFWRRWRLRVVIAEPVPRLRRPALVRETEPDYKRSGYLFGQPPGMIEM